jgi:F-type H+-transporting ATPase subunit b
MLKLDLNLLWTVVDVLILYVLLRKFLFKPIQNVLDQRQKMIEADIAAAQTSKTEAAAALTTAQDKLADEIVAAGKAAVEIERQNKLREADAQATALARSMCEKLLKHNLTAQDDDQLLDDLLQKAGAGNGN